MAILDSLQVFYGEATAARARVYARVPLPPEGEGWRLSGTITGPHSSLGNTLPATVRLRDRGPGPTLLAEAALPDPCFWSPKMPALYEVELELLDPSGEVREIAVRSLGIRALGVRGRSLLLEGKRWVLRGVHRRHDTNAPLEAWREFAAMLVESPDEQLCREASRQGVWLVAVISGNSREVEAELRRLSQSAAVAIAVVDCRGEVDEKIAAAAPNILLAQWANGSRPAAWANVTFATIASPEDFGRRFADAEIPIVAVRSADAADLHEARAGCDALQRDLAPYGDFAGYVMS
ncbi:MAG: hypothetical protein KY475_25715 [Planctomycetes bacterium]|nr:hypothetical protein [Planctomycetota bacterium]